MKIRKLMMCAVAAMTASCVGVYLLVPTGQAHEASAVAVTDDLPAGASIEEEEEEVEEAPASLVVEARVGHDAIDASGDRRTYVMVELRGSDDQAGGSFATSTALVLDTSGSMAGSRMVEAKQAARQWVQRAPDGDQVTIVGFAQRATEVVPRVSLDATTRPMVISALERLQPAGETCISCGLERASTLVADPQRIARVVVLSDGRATVGVRDVEGMRALATLCRDRGISVSTIGLGTGYNEKVLSALAFDANGLHHFVQNASDLPAVFQREDNNLRATVASSVSANIDLAPGVQLVRVVDRQFRQSGQRVRVDVGSVPAGATRTVLLEVRVPGSLGETPVAVANVTFQDVVANEDRTLTRSLMTTVGDTASALDGMVAMRLERMQTAAAIKSAAELFAAGKQREAVDVLDRRVNRLGPQAKKLSGQARDRGDQRAGDIEQDLWRQRESATRARNQFRKAKPKAPAPPKAAASAWMVESL